MRKKLLVLLLIGVLLITGCAYYPSGSEVDITYFGEINASNSTFYMEGRLSSGGGIPEQTTYSEVRVLLYAENGSVLFSKPLGDLNASSGELNVSLSAEKKPYYVVFDSNDFWSETVEVDYFVLQPDGTYTRKEAGSRDELPA